MSKTTEQMQPLLDRTGARSISPAFRSDSFRGTGSPCSPRQSRISLTAMCMACSLRPDRYRRKRVHGSTSGVEPWLRRPHPRGSGTLPSSMDIRLSGDISSLPFPDHSVDGIWNVGVMEHFEHADIYLILREFGRILRAGAESCSCGPPPSAFRRRCFGLWSGSSGFASRGSRFIPPRFHSYGRFRRVAKCLPRNGLSVVHIDWGFERGMAFETKGNTSRKGR